jgi:hypothetical protein
MYKHYLINLITLLSLIIPGYAQSQEHSDEVKSLVTFAKLYGQARYFYPGDEAAEMDWNRFAIAGVEEIRQLTDHQTELLPTLKRLFSPIATAVIIGQSDEIGEFDLASITPKNHKKLKPIYWQHLGVGNGNPNNVYQSIRINRKTEPVQDRNGEMVEFPETLFDTEVRVGEIVETELGQGLKAMFPLALYGDEQHTFPKADQEALAKLSERINQLTFPYNQGNQLPVRLASIIITWNVFQHFYPYFDLLELDWEKELYQSLTATYADQSFVDFRIRLEKMTAKLNDGHIQVGVLGDDSESGTPRFAWEWVEDQLVITKILDPEYKQVQIGEIIVEIDSQKPDEFFETKLVRISGSTPGWKRFRAQFLSLQGTYMGSFALKVKGLDGKIRGIEVKRDMRLKDFFRRYKEVKLTRELEPGIWYINLDLTPWPAMDTLLPRLAEAKAIICDLRGYPAGNHQLISHLLPQKDTSSGWMQIPQITRPDFQAVTWKKLGWNLEPAKPHLSAPMYFLTDGQAISYAESYMSFIKHYQLATIIGQPTAGTNGNVNRFALPGGYRISWTGMRVKKHDGRELSGSGIQPDIFVNRTIEGIIQGKDEYLERAMEEIKQ